MMKADIIIKNGHIMDPVNGTDQVGNVAVKGQKIVAYTAGMESDVVVDAAGCLVTPGLIDFHAHLFDRATDSGLNPDLAMLPQGVTTAADAGSSGVSTYRSFLDRLNTYYIKTRFFLHVSPVGQVTHQFPEPLWPDTWVMDKFASAFEIGGEKILGFKIRVSKDIVKEGGAGIFYETMRIAEHFQKPVVVHVTDPALPTKDIAGNLRQGDVFCHMYHGTGDTILDRDGKVLPEVLKAQKRGIIMDSCHGKANFSFDVAEKALAQGFRPDIISTDLTTKTWNKAPVYGLPHVMSKFLYLGLTEKEIIERVTKNPAKALKMDDQIGSLTVGTCADITILRVKDGDLTYTDSLNAVRKGTRYFAPQATILNGTIVYRAPELWQ